MKIKIGSCIPFILRYFRPYLKLLGVVLLFLIVEVFIVTAFSYSFKYIIDDALLKNNLRLLFIILTILICAGIFEVFVGVCEDYIYTGIISKVLRDMRGNIFLHMQNASLVGFSQNKTGQILSHFSNDLITVESLVSGLNSGLVTPCLFLIFQFILLATLNWKLTIFVSILSLLIFVGASIIAPKVAKDNTVRKNQESSLLTFVQENIAMQMVVRAFGLHNFVINAFSGNNESLTKQMHQVYFYSFLVVRSTDLTMLLVRIIMLAVGSLMVYKGLLTIGSLTAFFLIYSNALNTSEILATFFSNFVRNSVSLSRIEDYLAEQPNINYPLEPTSVQFKDELTFDHVNFNYGSLKSTIKDLNFTLKRGGSYAFVGPSGSGKSTIVRLIMRFYDPTSGKIMIDGTDIKDLSTENLYSLISYVPQDVMLFRVSIRENIRMGKLDATEKQIESAAKLAEIHDEIMQLPHGYDSVFDFQEGQSTGLSVGQRQRILIARAIIRNAPILIMDESTSNLDGASEAAINQTLLSISKNCTSIYVTHRLHAVKEFDRIFVMNKGAIAEAGKHEELLKQNGIYTKHWNSQSGFLINEEEDDVHITPERLQLVPLFKNINIDMLAEMTTKFRTERFSRNTVIIREGDVGDIFYIIVRGRVEVSEKQKNDSFRRIAILEDGDFFGEVALLKKTPRMATITAFSQTICLSLTRSQFDSFLNLHPEILKMIASAVEHRIQDSGGPNDISF